MKYAILFAIVATVAADMATNARETDKNNDKRIEVNLSVTNAAKSVDGVAAEVGAIADSMMSVDILMGGAKQLDAGLPGIKDALKMQTMQTDQDLKHYMDVMKNQQEVRMTEQVNSLATDVATRTRELGAFVAEVTTDAQRDAGQLSDTTANLLKRLNAHKACAKKKQVATYKDGVVECGSVKLPPSAMLRKVHHKMFTNDDGRDGGYINNRDVTFTKTEDATFIRVWYHDNMRVHGHTAYGRWNVMVCDVNGNGCDHCNNPGRLQYWKYSHHQHNWWMNDHHNGGMTGLCKSAGNRNMGKGTFKFRVMIDHNRYDMYTGHNTHSMLMVDEVFKL